MIGWFFGIIFEKKFLKKIIFYLDDRDRGWKWGDWFTHNFWDFVLDIFAVNHVLELKLINDD